MNVYVHVPFCRSKCGYCVFYSLSGAGAALRRRYLTRLRADITAFAAKCEAVETVYVGGGTPSFLSVAELEELLAILKLLPLTIDAECSVEANPESLTAEKAALLRTFFNRLSMGIQSFSPSLRESIGRQCSEKELELALTAVQSAGFPHFNLDLMYGLPGETAELWRRDLQLAASSGADHISCYSLTPEPGAALTADYRTDDELEAVCYEMAAAELARSGIERYEISNYARPGCGCRHNINVWRGGLLAGFGPSAAGFDGNNRIIQPPDLARWLAGEPPELDILEHSARLREIFAVNLRTVAGWRPELWAQVPGADAWECRLAAAAAAAGHFPGALMVTRENITLSEEGRLFWDDIAQELL